MSTGNLDTSKHRASSCGNYITQQINMACACSAYRLASIIITINDGTGVDNASTWYLEGDKYFDIVQCSQIFTAV